MGSRPSPLEAAFSALSQRYVPDPQVERFVDKAHGRFKYDRHCHVVLTAEESRRHWSEIHPIRRRS